jgi:hypothetical protein
MNWSPKLSSRLTTTATFGLRIVELAIFIVIMALSILVFWNGGLMSRPTPTKVEYSARYFEYFDASQIKTLEYVYEGAIGGEITMGKAKFRGSVTLKPLMIEARIKAGLATKGMYDPAKMTESDIMLFRDEWKKHAGGTIPSWFDFPFDRKLRTITESSEGSKGHPGYEKVWYIDDEHNVVYIRGISC